MDSMEEFKAFFIATKPIIANLDNNHSVKSLEYLKDKIEKSSPELIQKLDNFLLHPLVDTLMKENLSCDEKQKLNDVIGAVINKSEIKHVQQFLTLYTLACQELIEGPNSSKTGLSEELQLSVLTCLKIFVKRLVNQEELLKLYSSNAPILCQGVFLAIQIATKEKATHLRCAALEFLLAVSQYDSENKEIGLQVANTFAKFTPGIIGPLSNLIIKEQNAHHSVILLALQCWGHIIHTVLMDFPNEISEDGISVIEKWMEPTGQKEINVMEKKTILSKGVRNQKWAEAAAETLEPLFEKIAENCEKYHQQVRCEIIPICLKILSSCFKNLGKASGIFLDMLVQSTNDDLENIRIKSQNALSTLNCNVVLLAQERLMIAMEKLTRNQRDGEKVKKLLNLIAAYLNVIQLSETDGPCILTNPLMLAKFLNSLVNISKTTLSDHLLHQYTSEPTDPRLFLLFQKTNENDKFLNEIYEHIGQWALENAIHLLIEKSTNPENELENLLFLTKIINKTANPKISIAQYLIQYFLEKNNEIDLNDNATAKEEKKSIVKTVLILHGIGYLSKSLGIEFEQFLLKTIYPVTEKLGSPYSVIKSNAYFAAEMMATACGCENVEKLIEENLDYLTHHIIIKLKRTSDDAVLDAVRVIAKSCAAKAVSQLQHVVNEILSTSASHIYSSHVEAYLRVFLAFACCAANNCKQPDTEMTDPIQLSAVQQLKEYITRKKGENVDNYEVESTQDEKPKLPPHVAMASNVVKRCLHYLPTCPDKQKVICLEILDTGLRVLAEWQDELLPLVHQIWSPLVRRFDAKAPALIISRSFRLLCTLTWLAKDFIRHRTLKEVLPTIRDFLQNSSKISRNHAKDIAYQTTQNYKLQRELLNGLGGITCDLKLFERETDWIVEAALPYLSQNQPKPLQKCAVGLYQRLRGYDPVLVAYRLQANVKNDQFQKNIQQILG